MPENERVDVLDVERRGGGGGARVSTYIRTYTNADRSTLEAGECGVSPVAGGVVVDLRVCGCRGGALQW